MFKKTKKLESEVKALRRELGELRAALTEEQAGREAQIQVYKTDLEVHFQSVYDERLNRALRGAERCKDALADMILAQFDGALKR